MIVAGKKGLKDVRYIQTARAFIFSRPCGLSGVIARSNAQIASVSPHLPRAPVILLRPRPGAASHVPSASWEEKGTCLGFPEIPTVRQNHTLSPNDDVELDEVIVVQARGLLRQWVWINSTQTIYQAASLTSLCDIWKSERCA